MANCSKGNFFLGVLIGAAAGAAAAYFSDRRTRELFADNVSSSVERARDSIVEGYYEAKERYQRYRNRLTDETQELIDELKDEE